MTIKCLDIISGNILDIKRFSIHDGPGIRTTVFLKGCPLHCLWCHNPESISLKKEIGYLPEKCIGCGECVKACPNSCHRFEDGIHYYERKNCVSCALCTKTCFTGALKTYGEQKNVDEVYSEIAKDISYYIRSGGGVTLSGGEPMAQYEFTKSLLKALKNQDIHTCLETCGQASTNLYEEINQYVDLFLFDYKETDPKRHKEYTGVDNSLIQKNLHRLDSIGASIILRCPIIPGLNDRDDHLKGIAEAANRLKTILEINLMPYHPYGNYKNDQIGRRSEAMEFLTPEETDIMNWIRKVQENTDIPVKKG
jgi:glycyl-radical enzyme activating protein